MKNSIIPKRNNLFTRFPQIFAFIAVFAFLFSACEQDSIIDTDDLTQVTQQREKLSDEELQQTEAPISLKDANDLNTEITEMTADEDEVTERSRVKLFESYGSVSRGNWKGYYIRTSSLPDPMLYKLEVVVTPLSGDPDLYFYGYDNGSFRYVRASAWVGTESLTFRKSGLHYDEESAYIGVKGYSNAQFKIQIYRVPVDCKEYPTANQTTTLEYFPVCGCDGVQYSNIGSAVIAGVTSWSNGPCCNAARDCISFDGCCLEIRVNADGSTTLLDGNHAVKSAPNVEEGLRILEIMEHYNIDQHCFVGRPDPSLTFLLSNGQSPVGAIAGEDCLSFNPNNIEVRLFNGRWKIMEGNMIMLDFANNRQEAEDAKCFIQQYGFTQQCFVGRPYPSLEYFRK